MSQPEIHNLCFPAQVVFLFAQSCYNYATEQQRKRIAQIEKGKQRRKTVARSEANDNSSFHSLSFPNATCTRQCTLCTDNYAAYGNVPEKCTTKCIHPWKNNLLQGAFPKMSRGATNPFFKYGDSVHGLPAQCRSNIGSLKGCARAYCECLRAFF